MDTSWYLIKVLPGKERQLCEHFNKEISLEKIKNVIRFVCPTEKNLITVKNKKVLREKVIYSGYLYFETKEKLDESELKVLASQESIMRLLSDKTPVLLRKSDVNKILMDDILDEHNQSKNLKLEPGVIVVVNDGPFAGFNGVISTIKDDKIEVEIKIFGRSTNVSLNFNQVNKI